MRFETNNSNTEFYVASLALGILEGMKQGVIHPEIGIWSLGRPIFLANIKKTSIISKDLNYVIDCFDEIDLWASSENNQKMQIQMIDELRNICIKCLEIINYSEIDLVIEAKIDKAP